MMKATYILLISTLLYLNGAAQNIDDNNLQVVKDFSKDLYKAEPIYIDIHHEISENGPVDKSREALLSMDTYEPSITLDIEPIAYEAINDNSGKTGFLRLNKGTTNPWSGEAYVGHQVDNYFHIFGHIAYDQWRENDISNKYLSDLNGQIGMKYYINDHLMSTIRVQGGGRTYGNYRYNHKVINQEINEIAYDDFDLKIDIASFNDRSTDWNVNAVIELNNTNTASIKENLWSFSSAVQKGLNDNWSVAIQSYAQLSSNYNFDNLTNISNTLSFQHRNEKWTGSIGANHTYWQNNHKVIPTLSATIYPNKQTRIAINLDQQVDYLGLQQISQINPYTDFMFMESPMSRLTQKAEIAVNTDIAKVWTLNVSGSLARVYDDANYVSESEMTLMDISSVDYQIASGIINLDYRYSDYLDFGLSSTYRHYISDDGVILYHRPTLEFCPMATIHTKDDKISASLSANINTGQNLRHSELQGVVKSGIRKELSFNAKYSPTNTFSINVSAENILNDDYEVLDGYQVFGRNLSAGLVWAF